jgi:hypothetical protein
MVMTLFLTPARCLRARLLTRLLPSAGLRLEIPQQPLQCLLKGVMLFPFPEVANEPLTANGRRPSRRRIHNRVVQPHGEQSGPLLPMPGTHLLSHPIALHAENQGDGVSSGETPNVGN